MSNSRETNARWRSDSGRNWWMSEVGRYDFLRNGRMNGGCTSRGGHPGFRVPLPERPSVTSRPVEDQFSCVHPVVCQT